MADVITGRRRSTLRPNAAIALATVGTLIVVLPVFLLGGLAVFMTADLGFRESGLGLAVAVFFGSSVVGSFPGGLVSEHLGPERALGLAAIGGGISLLAMAVVVHSYPGLVAALIFGGLANGVVHPAANLLLVRRVTPERQGIAFGIKQASVLFATLFAGIAVPLLALTVGWRWAFAGGAAVAIATAVFAMRLPPTAPGRRPARGRMRTGDVPLRPMLLLATAAGLGGGTAVTMGSFMVPSATAAGLAPEHAGILLATGSLTAASMRIATGWLADGRLRNPLVAVGVMMGMGAIGLFSIALGGMVLLVLGTLLGFGVGWGWHGLLNLAVVNANPNSPAAASAITEGGAFIGCVVLPFAFGATAANASYGAAWLGGGIAMALAAGLTFVIGPHMVEPRS
jgi:predicted MFS family arabinose efflux permease